MNVKVVAKVYEGDLRDGGGGWEIFVDGRSVAEVDSDEMEIGDNALNPLWEALGVKLEFDFD